MGKTQDKIDKRLAEFDLLNLEEKLKWVYEETLYERYGTLLDHEWHAEHNTLDDFEVEMAERDLREMRIAALEFTDKEILFLCKASGMWDGMIKNGVTIRLGMTFLALICDKKNPQVFQNIVSKTHGGGSIDLDWTLSPEQEQELFAKLDGLEVSRRGSVVTNFLERWLLKVRRQV